MFQVFQFNEANVRVTWLLCYFVNKLTFREDFKHIWLLKRDALMLAESWSDSKYMGKRVLVRILCLLKKYIYVTVRGLRGIGKL